MSRPRPSDEEILNAINESIARLGVVRFENVRYQVQLRLKTVAKFARQWMREALTAPGQEDLVLLYSDDSKNVYRIVRHEDSGNLSYYGDLREGAGLLMMYLDRSGNRTDDRDEAVRNEIWIMPKAILDKNIAALLKQKQEKQAERDKEKDAENFETEGVIGVELSMIRGMLAAADITSDSRTLTAWAARIDKGEGKTVRRARATLELNAKQLVALAKWLMDKGVEPVAAPGMDKS